MIQIQVALDRLALDRAVAIAAQVAPWVDGVEVGTSLVKQHGMAAVRAVADAVAGVPGVWVHADLKTVDDAVTEVSAALDAGAWSVSVLALASDATVDAAVDAVHARDGEVVLDLMLTTVDRRRALAGRLDPRVRLAAHVGKDDQAAGGAGVLAMLGDWSTGRRLAVAGGLGLADVPGLRDVPELRLVVGSAVTGAADPARAARRLDLARREQPAAGRPVPAPMPAYPVPAPA